MKFLLADVFLAMALASTGDAFSFSIASSSSRPPSSPRTFSHAHPQQPLGRASTVSFGSLRDILESAGGNDDGNENGDDATNRNDSNNGYPDSPADNFNNLIEIMSKSSNPIRNRVKSGGRGGGTSSTSSSSDDDELGLHGDRLSTFSFGGGSGKSKFSGVGGGGGGARYNAAGSSGGAAAVASGSSATVNALRPRDVSFATSGSRSGSGEGGATATSEASDTIPDEASSTRAEGKEDDNAADAPAGISPAAAAKSVPIETKRLGQTSANPFSYSSSPSSNAKSADSQANHVDQMRTFSFSSASDVGRPLRSGSDSPNERGRGIAVGPAAETGASAFAPPSSSPPPPATKTDYDSGAASAPATSRKIPGYDDQGDHADRLTTFSLSKASASGITGSTTGMNTKRNRGSNSLNPMSPNRIYSSNDRADDDINDNNNNNNSNNSNNNDSNNSQSPLPSLTNNKPASLSSLASSVKTLSRSERIQQLKLYNTQNLKKDGMNTPRLTGGGLSGVGGGGLGGLTSRGANSNDGGGVDKAPKNIFQRIEGMEAAEDVNREWENLVREVEGKFAEANDSGTGENGLEEDTTDDRGVNTAQSREFSDVASEADIDAHVSSDDDSTEGDCFVGFDLGTSGARMSIVEKTPSSSSDGAPPTYKEVFTASLAWDDNMRYDDAYAWRAAVDMLMLRASVSGKEDVLSRVKSMCVSGTSATCLLLKKNTLDVSREARMYNYDISSSSAANNDGNAMKSKGAKAGKNGGTPAERVLKLINTFVPEKHTARANTGSLAKLLLWNEESPIVDDAGETQEVLCHQSDYISLSLMHEGDDEGEETCVVASDWHNCLKLGYDVQSLCYPAWMNALLKEGANIPDPESVLPSKVVSPGEPMGFISPVVAAKYGVPGDVVLVGGTTDSNAAFFAAAGAKPEYGTAVTSLGSTLAIKQLSKTFVEDASRGVYSHRFPRFGDENDDDEGEEAWLIGGASNVGCAVLRQEGFTNEALSELSAQIDPESDSPLSYYPLIKTGERFPVADSSKEPILDPKPDDRKDYLHAILQGIGDVERDGFRILGELGATPDRPTVVLSCGGGAKNDMWIAMRERRLREICEEEQNVVVKRALNTEASYGAALLAAASFE